MNPADYRDFLVQNEGFCDFLYADRLGLVSTGIGNLVDPPLACIVLPWLHKASGESATIAEKLQAWHIVKRAFDPDEVKPAGFYAPLTDLRLTSDVIYRLVDTRLVHEFFPALVHVFPGLEGFPQPAKNGLVDLVYSLGVHAFGPKRWPTLVAACNMVPANWANVLADGTLDPRSAACQCHRDGGTPRRNAWTKDQFVAAAQHSFAVVS